MNQRDIIAIGGSAGGFRALRTILENLPPDLPAAILTTLHLNPDASESILRRTASTSPFRVAFAREGERIARGQVYVAPPDHHLIVDGERLLVRRGPMENGSRPAIDPLFRSAACHLRGRAVGVLLTGYLDDGVSGLIALRRCGGLIVVQDPDDAEVPDMPRNALERAEPHHVVPLSGMAPLLRRVIGGPAGSMAPPPPELELEVRISRQQEIGIELVEQVGTPSPFSCPECHGNLHEIRQADRVRYRCHTGHAYSLESLAAAQSQELERALSSALRALEERVHLLQRMSRDADTAGHNRIAEQFERRVKEYEGQAALIRNILVGRASIAASSGPERAIIPSAVPTALPSGGRR